MIWMDRWFGWRDGLNGRMVLMDEWMDGMDGWMVWMDGLDGWMDG